MKHSVLMVNSYRGYIGGVERLMVSMARALAEESWDVYGLFEQSVHEDPDFDAAFNEVSMWEGESLAEQIDHFKRIGIELVCIHKCQKSRWLHELKESFRTVLIVHDHDYYCLRHHKYFPYRRINCPLPFTLAGCSVCSGMLHKQEGKMQLINPFKQRQLLHEVRDCDLSFVLSDYMKGNLLMNGWDAKRIRLMVPYQDCQESSYAKPDGRPVILYVGQLIRGKGVDLLLKALAEVKEDYCCRILGRGNDEKYLRDLADQLGIKDRVCFAGFSADLHNEYCEARLLVFPSRWQEPFGLVGLEAYAHHIPVVAFDTGGVSQWLKHKVNGLAVKAKDVKRMAQAISIILNDPEQAQTYAEAGYRMVKHQYTRKAFKASFIPELEKLISSSPHHEQKAVEQKSGSLENSFTQEAVHRILSAVISLGFTLPLLIMLGIKSLFTNNTVVESHVIQGRSSQPLVVPLIRNSNWLIRHALLFPLAVTGKLGLVGSSIKEYQPHPDQNTGLEQSKPGIFSLHFIRSSSKIAMAKPENDDQEYSKTKSLSTDLKILLQSIPAMLYYHTQPVDSPRIDIFGIKMLNTTMIEAIQRLKLSLESRSKSEVFFVNADCLNKVFIDRDYYGILKDSKTIYPDGIGINLAGKMLGNPLRENVNGTDMLPYICEMAQDEAYSLYLLGAAEGVAEQMKTRLLGQYPALKICGTRNGFFDWDREADSVIEGINSSKADILLVGFGAPRQEKFIHQYAHKINATVQIGVGGLFDFYSGRIPRAPLWMRQIGMEWVFRLLQEPKRMWKRYILGNPLFLYRVYRWKHNRNFGRFGSWEN